MKLELKMDKLKEDREMEKLRLEQIIKLIQISTKCPKKI